MGKQQRDPKAGALEDLTQEAKQLRLKKEIADLDADIRASQADPAATTLEKENRLLELERKKREQEGQVADLEADASERELRGNVSRLTQEEQIAQLKAKLKELSLPWWRKSSSVATVTAIVAAILPVTTFVQGCVQKHREIAIEEHKQEQMLALESAKHESALQLARERQAEQVRTSYLERLKTPGEHLRTLRFIIATSKDPDLSNWAVDEESRIEGELQLMREDLARSEAEAAQKRQAYLDTLGKGGGRGGEIERRKLDAEAAEKAATEKKKHVNDFVFTDPNLPVLPFEPGGPLPG